MSGLLAARGALRYQRASWIGCVAGHRRSGGGLGRHSWHGISCLAPGIGPLSARDVARLAQRPSQAFTWCSRTRWHRIDFVAVPRDLFAGVKRAEVQRTGLLTMRCQLWRWSFRLRRRVTSVQGVLTRLAWPCGDLRFASRSSFSGLRHLPCSLGAFGGRARRVAGKGCAGGLEGCGSSGASCATGGLDGRGGLAGGPRSRCGKKGTPKGQSVSLPSMAQDVLRAVEACCEARQ